MDSQYIDKFRIYRFASEDGKGELIAELAKTKSSFTDQDLMTNKTYYYLVKSVNQRGKESRNLKRYSNIPRNTISPRSPFDIRVEQADKKIEISWTNPDDGDLAYIYVYKTKDQSVLGNIAAKMEAFASKKQKWADSDFEAYEEYYYTLVAVDNAGNRSPDIIIEIGNKNLFISKDLGEL